MKPNVLIRNETRRVFLRVTGTTVAILPNYPGSAGLEPGTILQTLAALDANKAERSEVASAAEMGTLTMDFEGVRNKVDGFGSQLEGLQTNQDDIRGDVDALTSTLQNLNIAGLDTFTVNANGNPVFTYTDGSSKTFTGVVLSRTFKGDVTAKPTGAGTMGDFYRNLNPAIDVIEWMCTTSGAAGAAVWTPRGGKVYEDMAFEFVSNDTYDYPVATARTLAAPNVFGATATVVWSYAVGTGAFNSATFPLNMVAGSVLRATVTGLAAGTKRYAALVRTA